MALADLALAVGLTCGLRLFVAIHHPQEITASVERVELVGTRVARDRVEAVPPRGIVPALRGAELQDEGRRGSGHASTGAPAAAEA